MHNRMRVILKVKSFHYIFSIPLKEENLENQIFPLVYFSYHTSWLVSYSN